MLTMFKSPEPSVELVRTTLTKFCQEIDNRIRDGGDRIFIQDWSTSLFERRIIRNMLEIANVPIECFNKYETPQHQSWKSWIIYLTKNSFIDKLEEGFAKKYPDYYRNEILDPAPPSYSSSKLSSV